jgi:hypothetical protein
MNSQPRTQVADEAVRDAAYRRLMVVALKLDVATLAQELRMARLDAEAASEFAKAA